MATSGRREPLRPLRLFWIYFRIGALNELQYRANLAVQVFQSLIALGTGLAVLGLVYSQTTTLGGWTHAELLAVMGVHILMSGPIGVLIQPNMERLMEDIRQGTLDFVLTKPEDAQTLISIREVRIWSTVDAIVGLSVLVFAVAQLQAGLGLVQALAFVAALLLGGLTIYCFWQIVELFTGLYQSGRWPVSIYPGWLRVSLTYLVPIAFAVTVPAEALTSRLTPETLALAFGFAAAIFAFTRWWWRFGLRHYGGASA